MFRVAASGAAADWVAEQVAVAGFLATGLEVCNKWKTRINTMK